MNTQKPVYLDHAAATPVDSRVLQAMLPFFTEQFYNPSAQYEAGRRVRMAVDDARRVVAHYLGARPAEIIFTAGCTEANNLAIKGVMDSVLPAFRQAKVLMSSIEHESVLETGKQYAHSVIPVTGQGVVDVAALQAAIDDQTVLVCVMYANNEIGTVQPIRAIGQLLATVRRGRRGRGNNLPLYFHTDAAQAGNYLDLHAARLGVDLLTLNGGKIYGPKQSGALYVRGGLQIASLIVGGGQERNLRSGTENVPAIVGFARSLEIAQELRHAESQRLAQLQKYFFGRLVEQLPAARINGTRSRRLPNNLHITLPGQDNERLLFQLDAAGIMAAAGSACSAGSRTASHVLEALGLSQADARSSLRLTMGRETSQADLDRTLQTLRNITSGSAQ